MYSENHYLTHTCHTLPHLTPITVAYLHVDWRMRIFLNYYKACLVSESPWQLSGHSISAVPVQLE